MFVQQLQEHIVKGSVYCISKNQSQNRVFQPSENLYLEDFSPSASMIVLMVES